MRSTRFLSGVILGYTYQALVMGVGLWLTPFLLGRIGLHEYGVWLIGLQMLAYLGLIDVGVVALLPREIAYATGRAGDTSDSSELPLIIGRTARLVLYQTPIIAAAAAAVWYLFPASSSQARSFSGLILASYTLLFPARIFRATVEGLQDMKYLGRVQIVAWLVGTATTVGLVMAKAGLYALAIGWVVTQVAITASMAYRICQYFPQVLPKKRSDFTAAGAGKYLKSGFWASLTQIATPLITGSDILLIGRMLGAAAVVPYSCTGKLITILSNQPQMLLELAMPGLSEIKAGQSQEHIFRVTSALAQGSLMLSGGVAFVVLAVNHGFVSWWVGERLYSGYELTVVIAACMLLRHWNLTTIYAMFCYGLERRLSVTTLADGIVTVAVCAGLIAWLGPIGAPIGSIIGVCVVSLPANLTALAREAGVSLRGLLRPIWPWSWRFALVIAAASAFARVWVPHNFAQTAAVGLLAALLYVAVMISIGEKSVLWPYLRPRVMPVWELVSAKFVRSVTCL